MKNSKFIFVPMLATSVFIFAPTIANAEDRMENVTSEENFAEESMTSVASETDKHKDHSTRKSEIKIDEETSQNLPSQPKNNNIDENNTNSTSSESEQTVPEKDKTPNSGANNSVDIEGTEKPYDISQKNLINEDLKEQASSRKETNEQSGSVVQIEEDEPSDEPSQQTSNTQVNSDKEVKVDESSNQKHEIESNSSKENTKSHTIENSEPTELSDINKSDKKHIEDVKTSINNNETEHDDKPVDTSTRHVKNNKDESKRAASTKEEAETDEGTPTSVDDSSKESVSDDEVENINEDTLKGIRQLKLNADTSVKMYSFDTKAESRGPVVTEAQYAAKFTDGKHSGLYSPVTSSEGVSLDFMDGKTVFITQKAKYNGTTYYRVHQDLNGAMQGWVKEKDLRLFNISDSSKHNKDYAVSKRGQSLLTNPWGTAEQQKANLDNYDTKLFRAEEKLTLGSLTFYYGKINDDYGWLQDTKLKKAAPPKTESVNYAARLDTNKSTGLYSPVTSRNSHNYDFMKNKTIFITQKADYNGTIFYRVHSTLGGAMQGWINEKDLNKWQIFGPATHKKQYAVVDKNDYLLSDPYGTNKQTIKKLSSYGNSNFKAEKKLKIGALTYYYGKIGNDYGWLADSKIKSAAPKISNARFAVRVADSNNSGIYSPVTSNKGQNLGKLEDMTLYTTKRAVYDDITYYRVHSDVDGAMQGWIKENDLNLWKIFGPDSQSKKYSIANSNQYLLETPYGTSLQRISKLSNYGNAAFQAQKSIKIGQITFLYGKIGNDYGWVQENRLEDYIPVAPSPNVNTVKYNQSFNQVLNTQMNLRSKPQAWVSGGGWRNASRSEVARFLDTSHQTSETWMYTFLDLNRSQNIASSTINSKLLSGKGTLNNQGSAFLNASKTQGINEVYLISHALHETGNGTSTLAQGVRLDSNGNISSNGKKYYNMYGIAAYDHNPVLAGARYAQQMGWDTPAKAIIGGARFISQSYFNRGQTTLYSMRWNPANPGTYQYATDVNWAYATAQNLRNYYKQLGIRGQYYTKHIF